MCVDLLVAFRDVTEGEASGEGGATEHAVFGYRCQSLDECSPDFEIGWRLGRDRGQHAAGDGVHCGDRARTGQTREPGEETAPGAHFAKLSDGTFDAAFGTAVRADARRGGGPTAAQAHPCVVQGHWSAAAPFLVGGKKW